MKYGYKLTIFSCFLSYVVQAIVINFAPLLFLTFQSEFGIPIEQITLLVTLNFIVQLLTDLASSKFIHKIGYRKGMLLAHALSVIGLASLTFLPDILSGFPGLLISVMIYAVGGGLLEVLVSPIVEGCPTKNKAGIMSLMHSFYCWGTVFAVLVSTGFFVAFGIENWRYITLLWAVIPVICFFLFLKAPIYPINEENDDKPNYKELLSQKAFIILFIIMICAGASEQAVAQWTSTFAESTLHLDKTVGDLLGVCGFAVMMGLSRLIYAKLSEKLPMKRTMMFSAVLCIVSYLLVGLTDSSLCGLIGCILCGFSVGLFWPGTFSLATASIKGCGTTMFALLALAGDMGCSAGPTVVGFVSGIANNDFKSGILAAVLFPLILFICLLFLKKSVNTDNN